ncbi:hypothetical protein N7449_006616 [Penicillium cf. viridicatum]|uniref:Uncharacterized protein n=1 Tax=Penicillium cf. viridicatum TaxID=2972119 RepID=A0A9W9JHP3_9EURO|nr:hypothetical protein N7449_006616 [Penicillium cf. viridicatum]
MSPRIFHVRSRLEKNDDESADENSGTDGGRKYLFKYVKVVGREVQEQPPRLTSRLTLSRPRRRRLGLAKEWRYAECAPTESRQKAPTRPIE